MGTIENQHRLQLTQIDFLIVLYFRSLKWVLPAKTEVSKATRLEPPCSRLLEYVLLPFSASGGYLHSVDHDRFHHLQSQQWLVEIFFTLYQSDIDSSASCFHF